jgi:hypothetical protein
MKIKIFTFICILVCSIFAQDNGIKIESFVDKNKCYLDENIILTIRVYFRQDIKDLNINEVEPPSCTNLDLIGSSTSNKVSVENNIPFSIKESNFILKPKEIGMAYIDPSRVKYSIQGNEQVLVTTRISLEILPPKGKPKWKILVINIVMALIILVCIIAIVFILKRIKKLKEEKNKQVEIVLTPEEKALIEIDKINITEEIDSKNIISDISNIFRKYLSEKYNIKAIETITSQIIEQMEEKDLTENIINATKEILEFSDIVKFSGYKTQREEVVDFVKKVKTLIEINKNIILKEEVIKENE